MRKILILFLLNILISILFSCTKQTENTPKPIENIPKLIDVYVDKITKMGHEKKYAFVNIFQSLDYDDTVLVGQSPVISIVCENIEKDVFIDVEIYDSYYPESIFSYSGNSDQYKARVSTTLSNETNIWTTKISITLQDFDSKDDRVIIVKKINFLRQFIGENIVAELPEENYRTLSFNVNPIIPINYYNEVLYFEFYYFYRKQSEHFMYVLFDTQLGTLRTTFWNASNQPNYEEIVLIIPNQFLNEPIDFLQISYKDPLLFKLVLTTLNYPKQLSIDIGSSTLYCTFGPDDVFMGEKASEILSEVAIYGDIVYNYSN